MITGYTRFRSGLTLMEMVIALVIMTVVFAAVLPQFRLIHNSWDTRQASADTVQNGRVFVDYLNRNLAKAVTITSVSSSTDTDGFIEFTDIDGAAYRCDIGADGFVEFGETSNQSSLAGPVSSLVFYCYSLDDLENPTETVEDIRLVKAVAVFSDSSDIGSDKTFSATAFLQANGNVEEVQNQGSSLPGIIVKDYIEFGGWGAYIDSYHSSQGAYSPSSATGEAVVTTNSNGSGKFVMYSAAVIYGDGYVGQNGDVYRGMSLWGGSQITGTKGVLEENMEIPNNNFPSYDIFPNYQQGHGHGHGHGYGYYGGYGSYELNLWGGMEETVTENTYYTNVYINSGTKLIIDGNVTIGVGGVFYLNQNGYLELTEGSTLNLYINSDVSIGGYMNLGGTPDDLRIYMTSNRDFLMYGQSAVYAVVTNPQADFEIWNQASFYGLVLAEDFYGGCPVHVDLDSSFDHDPGRIGGGSGSAVILP